MNQTRTPGVWLRRLGVGQINNGLFGLANRDLPPLMCVDFPCHGEQEARNARTGKEL
jgi:hypothetical protein